MNDTKNPLASMGVWGSIGALILGFAAPIGSLLGWDPSTATTHVTEILTGIAAVVALVGRLRATHVLKF